VTRAQSLKTVPNLADTLNTREPFTVVGFLAGTGALVRIFGTAANRTAPGADVLHSSSIGATGGVAFRAADANHDHAKRAKQSPKDAHGWQFTGSRGPQQGCRRRGARRRSHHTAELRDLRRDSRKIMRATWRSSFCTTYTAGGPRDLSLLRML